MRKERKCNSVWAMTLACLSSWVHSPRTVIALVFIFALCLSEAFLHQGSLAQQELALTWGETLYYYLSYGCNILMSSALFLVMADELPRQIAFQNHALIRTNRVQWLMAQLLFCVLLVLIMLALCSCAILLASIGHSIPGKDWSDIAAVEQGWLMESQDGIVSAMIRNSYTTLEATGLAALPLFLFWLTMLLVIVLFGLYGKGIFGLSLCLMSVLSSLIVMNIQWTDLPLPIFFSTLSYLIASSDMVFYWRVIGGYGVIIAGLIGFMICRVKRADLHFA